MVLKFCMSFLVTKYYESNEEEKYFGDSPSPPPQRGPRVLEGGKKNFDPQILNNQNNFTPQQFPPPKKYLNPQKFWPTNIFDPPKKMKNILNNFFAMSSNSKGNLKKKNGK